MNSAAVSPLLGILYRLFSYGILLTQSSCLFLCLAQLFLISAALLLILRIPVLIVGGNVGNLAAANNRIINQVLLQAQRFVCFKFILSIE